MGAVTEPVGTGAEATAAPRSRKRVAMIGLVMDAPAADVERAAAAYAGQLEIVVGLAASLGGRVFDRSGQHVQVLFGPPEVERDPNLVAVIAADRIRTALSTAPWRIAISAGEVIQEEGDPPIAYGPVVDATRALLSTSATGEVRVDATVRETAGAIATFEGDDGSSVLGEVRARDLPRVERLIGRESERREITHVLDQAIDSRRCVRMLLLAPPGLGKTHLLDSAASELASKARVVRSQCSPSGMDPFEPFLSWVRQLSGITDAEQDVQARIAARLPASGDKDLIVAQVCDLFEGSEETSASNPLWGARRFLEEHARTDPLALIVEDVHWASPIFLDALEHLTDWTADAPILLLCTGRPEVVERRPELGWLKGNARSMTLAPLTVTESRQLARILVPAEAAQGDLVDLLVGSSKGNPLFIVEAVAMLNDLGLTAAGADLQELPTAAALGPLVAARVHALQGEERMLVQAAATVGENFRAEDVAYLVGMQEGNALGALGRLRTKDLIELSDDVTGYDLFRFRHSIIRDAAYDMTPKETRADLHRSLAIRYREHERPDETIAFHLEQSYVLRSQIHLLRPEDAEMAREAASLLATAGRRQVSRGDVSGAADLLRRALALEPFGTRDWTNIAIELCDVELQTGHLTEANDLVAQVGRLALERDDVESRARAAVMAAWYEVTVGYPRSALIHEMEALIPYFESEGDHTGLVRVLRLQALCHWTAGDCAGTQRRLEMALPHSLLTPRKRDLGSILSTLSAALYWGPAPISEALARCEELSDVAPDNRLAKANLLIRVAGLQALRGDLEDARRLAEQSRRELSDLGQALTLSASSVDRAWILDLAGDLEGAEKELRAGYQELSEIGETGFRATSAAKLAGVLYALGRTSEVEELLDIADTDGADDPTMPAETYPIRAQLAADAGRSDDAARLVEDARRAASITDMPVLKGMVELQAAQVLTKLGWTAGAEEAATRAREAFAAKGATVLEERARRFSGSGAAGPS